MVKGKEDIVRLHWDFLNFILHSISDWLQHQSRFAENLSDPILTVVWSVTDWDGQRLNTAYDS